ncbi:hypothetical protein [Sinorhizobium meliloti]|nr:hypothetical protein [Sinorhizobium meliloti]
MSVQAMFYVKEINHRATSQPVDVNAEVKLAEWPKRNFLTR